uniref:FIST_C domain-containing protein n=1 Tax=Heterorhabditis bacteriophora TaxID=37862 RepID=A0A1I7XI71_HETBA
MSLSLSSGVVMSFMVELIDVTPDKVKSTLQDVSTRARTETACNINQVFNEEIVNEVMVVCLTEGTGLKRDFMLAAFDGGFISDEYVYIFADTKSKGFEIPLLGGTEKFVWNDSSIPPDGRDDDAKEAFKNMMGTGGVAENYSVFGNELISRMSEPPFLCTTDCADDIYKYRIKIRKILKVEFEYFYNVQDVYDKRTYLTSFITFFTLTQPVV